MLDIARRAVFPVLVVAVWMAGLLTLETTTGDGNAQGALAVGYTIAAGFLIGRRWVLAVPVVWAALTLALLLVFGTEDESGVLGSGYVVVLFAVLAEACLLLGATLGGSVASKVTRLGIAAIGVGVLLALVAVGAIGS